MVFTSKTPVANRSFNLFVNSPRNYNKKGKMGTVTRRTQSRTRLEVRIRYGNGRANGKLILSVCPSCIGPAPKTWVPNLFLTTHLCRSSGLLQTCVDQSLKDVVNNIYECLSS